jgi:hypothetical protein
MLGREMLDTEMLGTETPSIEPLGADRPETPVRPLTSASGH